MTREKPRGRVHSTPPPPPAEIGFKVKEVPPGSVHIPGALEVSQSCIIESFGLNESIWAENHLTSETFNLTITRRSCTWEFFIVCLRKLSHNSKFSLVHFLDSNQVPSPDTFALENSQSHASKNSHTPLNSLSYTPPNLSIVHLRALTRMLP